MKVAGDWHGIKPLTHMSTRGGKRSGDYGDGGRENTGVKSFATFFWKSHRPRDLSGTHSPW